MLVTCISQGIPIPFGKLCTEEGSFIGKPVDEELEVVDQGLRRTGAWFGYWALGRSWKACTLEGLGFRFWEMNTVP